MPQLINIKQVWSKCPSSTGARQLSPIWFLLMGILEDVLSAGYVTMVDAGRGLYAGMVASCITFLAVFALSNILLEPKFLSMRLWLFAVGNFCGTWLVVSLR
jgi:hypothetical protein